MHKEWNIGKSTQLIFDSKIFLLGFTRCTSNIGHWYNLGLNIGPFVILFGWSEPG